MTAKNSVGPGSMTFVVLRITLSNQRGERVAVIDNRFMHR